jgi:hypothetical protein
MSATIVVAVGRLTPRKAIKPWTTGQSTDWAAALAMHLTAIYYPGPAGADAKALNAFCGGYDSTLEALYFALARGYSVLTQEGPGLEKVAGRSRPMGSFLPERMSTLFLSARRWTSSSD